MMLKKGQAAMEFLMTYGWAILVVLAAIGALAYFGVLDSDNLAPERCVLESGIACEGHKVTPSEITLVLRNGMGQDIEINDVTVGSCSITGQNIEFDNAKQASIELTGCSNGEEGARFDGDITVAYTNPSTNLNKTFTGSLSTKVEP